MLALATIVDDRWNEGALLQSWCMLRLTGSTAVWWDRGHEGGKPGIARFRQRLKLSPKFDTPEAAVEWINTHSRAVIVGSDEVLNFGSPPLFPGPNYYFGCGLTVPCVALAVCAGSMSFARLPLVTQQEIRNGLRRFSAIYVRDRFTAAELGSLGVPIDGFLPDPTFAFDFETPNPIGLNPEAVYALAGDGSIPGHDLEPPEWFRAFSEMGGAVVDRMHALLACLRGGTPCLLTPRARSRAKVMEVVEDFGLPPEMFGSDLAAVKRRWPYDSIARRCEAYRESWRDASERIKAIWY